MKKFISLMKAILSQDMSIFKYKTKANSSRLKKMIIPLLLTGLIMYAAGVYAYMIAKPLAKLGLTNIMLTLFMLCVTLTSFFEGIYKSQGMLFDCKDNDLLFSLPIEKSKIFAGRIIKLLLFQFIYNTCFILPAFAIYAYFENPGMLFYIISLMMLVILPIIPTILAVIVGYMITGISSKFKVKRLLQTVLTLAIFVGIFFASFNAQNLINHLLKNATSINDAIMRLYYPIGAYNKLILEFDITELAKLLLINIVPAIIVIYLGSIKYFKIISNSKAANSVKAKKLKEKQIKVTRPLQALIKKELKKFFTTPIYMFNTLFGVCIMLVISIALLINSDAIIKTAISGEGVEAALEKIYNILPKIFLQLSIFVACTTSITASSISIEGKSFNITKSLPVKEEKILLSKLLMSLIVTLPLMIISDIIFFIKFTPQPRDIFFILAYTITVPTFIAIMGLIINLKYPKMNASNDTEVVKQSLSTTIAIFVGMLIFAITTLIMIRNYSKIDEILVIELAIFILASIVLWEFLKHYGKKKIKEINI